MWNTELADRLEKFGNELADFVAVVYSKKNVLPPEIVRMADQISGNRWFVFVTSDLPVYLRNIDDPEAEDKREPNVNLVTNSDFGDLNLREILENIKNIGKVVDDMFDEGWIDVALSDAGNIVTNSLEYSRAYDLAAASDVESRRFAEMFRKFYEALGNYLEKAFSV